MSDNFSMIQWKVPVSSVPKEVYHTTVRHVKQLQGVLEQFPTENTQSLTKGEVETLDSIPTIVKEMQVVRSVLIELDAILENGSNMLAGYYRHMTAPPEESTEEFQEEDTTDAPDIPTTTTAIDSETEES